MTTDQAGDWYWDIERQLVVRLDNAGRRDLLIGPYATRRDAEIWLPSQDWSHRDDGDEWVDVNSAYD